MNYLVYIITNVPCFIQINEKLLVCENEILIETNEKEFLINCYPKNSNDFSNFHYIFKQKYSYTQNVKITKYYQNYKINITLKALAVKYGYYLNETTKIFYDNGYNFCYKNQIFKLENFENNYYELCIKNLKNYFLLLGKSKINEDSQAYITNQKIDYALFSVNNNCIVHSDSCNFINENDTLIEFYTYLFDQHKHILRTTLDFKDNLKVVDFCSMYTKGKPENLIYKEQIARAFFECILAQNNTLISTFLSEDLKTSVLDKNLHAFFNNFVGIDNLFLNQNNEINLISKVSKNLFEAKTYTIEFENEKISNIKC